MLLLLLASPLHLRRQCRDADGVDAAVAQVALFAAYPASSLHKESRRPLSFLFFFILTLGFLYLFLFVVFVVWILFPYIIPYIIPYIYSLYFLKLYFLIFLLFPYIHFSLKRKIFKKTDCVIMDFVIL